MPVGRRGLVVPQNTFLENIVRRSNGLHPNFLLGNAQILDNPVVYVSDGFCRLTSFSRSEVMKKSCDCTFLEGEHTETESMKQIHDALIGKQALQLEIVIYKKDGMPMWVLLHIGPIVNENGEVVLFLFTIKDITEYKEPIPGTDQAGAKGWARLNKSLTRHKTVLVAFKQKTASQKNAQQITHLMSLNDDIIPEYKQEIPETPPRVILHYNTFKTSWDWLILILTLYTTVSVPFIVCFAYSSEPLNILDMMVDWLFIADIVLNFHTTYVGKDGEVIDDPRLIRTNYLKTWFVLDLVSSLPYGILYFVPSTQLNQSEIANLLGFLRVFRLLRLGRVARKIDKYLEYGASTFFLLMLSFCLVAHWMACLFYVIAVKYDEYNEYCWLYALAKQIGMPYQLLNGTSRVDSYTKTGPTIPARYVSALYYTLTSLTTIGFGNISPNTTAEKLFGCVTMLLGSVLFSLIFGQVSAILQQSQKNTAMYHSIIDNMRQFSKLYKLPQFLADRIIDYFMSTWASNKGIDTDEVLKYCPKDLQADICVHLNRVVLENNLAFRDAPNGVKRAIARNFWICHVAPNDRIIHHGESLDVLYFIARGSLEVKQGDAVVGLLGEGDVFGDNVCNEPMVGQSAVDVHALTYSDLHCIQRDALIEVLEFYPEFAYKFAKNLSLSYNLRDELTIRRRTPSIVIQDEDWDDKRPLSVTYKGKRGRKLSLVEELVQTYDIQDTYLDAGSSIAEEALTPVERMVIPEGRKSPKGVRSKPELYQDTVDVISSLSEMKGEVRREIEVMNMKMTQLEHQVSTILSLLKSQGHLHSPPSGTPIGSMNEQIGTADEFQDSMDTAGRTSPVPRSPVASSRGNINKTSTSNKPSRSPRHENPNEDPLPDWLAPAGSSISQHSIPDWENQKQERNAESAARLLNQDERNPTEESDLRAMQVLKFMQKK